MVWYCILFMTQIEPRQSMITMTAAVDTARTTTTAVTTPAMLEKKKCACINRPPIHESRSSHHRIATPERGNTGGAQVTWTDVDHGGSNRELDFELDMHPDPAGGSPGVGDAMAGHLLANRTQYSSSRSSLNAADSHRSYTTPLSLSPPPLASPSLSPVRVHTRPHAHMHMQIARGASIRRHE